MTCICGHEGLDPMFHLGDCPDRQPWINRKTHWCPEDGSGLTRCCGKTPFEIPPVDFVTDTADQVTCRYEPPVDTIG